MIYFILIFIFIFGLIIGSFLNCLIYRLHENKSMMGRSFCPKCKKQIAWYDNIPILSFLFLNGKCRYCKQKISWQYPLVEFITGILFVIAFIIEFSVFQNQNILMLFRSWFIISVMIVIFIYDLKWYLILDIITLPASLILLIWNLYLGMNWQNMLISVIIGIGFFLSQFLISRGKWIGGGDIRLGMLMGLSLGWPMILVAIILAYFIGSVIGILLILFKKKKFGSKIPLGIFLSTATVITLFWGDIILDWYLNILKY